MRRALLLAAGSIAMGLAACTPEEVDTIEIQVSARGAATTPAVSGQFSASATLGPEFDLQAAADAIQADTGAQVEIPENQVDNLIWMTIDPSLANVPRHSVLVEGAPKALLAARAAFLELGFRENWLAWDAPLLGPGFDEAYTQAIAHSRIVADRIATNQSCTLGKILTVNVTHPVMAGENLNGRTDIMVGEFFAISASGEAQAVDTETAPVSPPAELTPPSDPTADVAVFLTATYEAVCDTPPASTADAP